MNRFDYELYKQVKHKVEHRLKSKEMQRKVAEYVQMEEQARQLCNTAKGKHAQLSDVLTCYSRDEGCGFPCLDKHFG